MISVPIPEQSLPNRNAFLHCFTISKMELEDALRAETWNYCVHVSKKITDAFKVNAIKLRWHQIKYDEFVFLTTVQNTTAFTTTVALTLVS